MGLLWSDGFDSYASTSDLSRNWSVASPTAGAVTWSASGGHGTGGGCAVLAAASNSNGLFSYATGYSVAAGTPVGHWFWAKISAIPAATVFFFQPFYTFNLLGSDYIALQTGTGFPTLMDDEGNLQ